MFQPEELSEVTIRLISYKTRRQTEWLYLSVPDLIALDAEIERLEKRQRELMGISSEEGERPLPQQRFQEEEILRVIRELNHEPQALPERPHGKRGVKAETRDKLQFTERVFNKAWERLRANGEIKGGE